MIVEPYPATIWDSGGASHILRELRSLFQMEIWLFVMEMTERECLK